MSCESHFDAMFSQLLHLVSHFGQAPSLTADHGDITRDTFHLLHHVTEAYVESVLQNLCSFTATLRVEPHQFQVQVEIFISTPDHLLVRLALKMPIVLMGALEIPVTKVTVIRPPLVHQVLHSLDDQWQGLLIWPSALSDSLEDGLGGEVD